MVERRIWIEGLGRSGTSWVYKTFDHHPDVRCLFEPESEILKRHGRRYQGDENICDNEIESYVQELFSARHLRSVRRRPILPKSFRNHAAHIIRLGLIYSASVIKVVGDRIGKPDLFFEIPDFSHAPPSHTMIKCVSRPYPLAQLARRAEDVKFLYILRHPCGTVQSTLRGIEQNKMPRHYLPNRSMLANFYAFKEGAFGVTEADFTQAEILSYRWGVYAGDAYLAAQALPNVRIVRYEDICRDPVGVIQEVFDWAELRWDLRCESFLREAVESEGDASDYHSFRRNPLIAASKWQMEMSIDMQKDVWRIAGSSPAAELFEPPVCSVSG